MVGVSVLGLNGREFSILRSGTEGWNFWTVLRPRVVLFTWSCVWFVLLRRFKMNCLNCLLFISPCKLIFVNICMLDILTCVVW